MILTMNRSLSQNLQAIIGNADILLGPRTLKSIKNVVKIQLRMSNGNPSISIICYSPTNASDEKDLDTFYNERFSLVRNIPKYNVQRRGHNAQIGKNKTNKFNLHSSSNRNEEHLTDFPLENKLTFQKRTGKLWTNTYRNNAKAQIDYILMDKK